MTSGKTDHGAGFNKAFMDKKALGDPLREGTHTPSDWGNQKLPEANLTVEEVQGAVPVIRADFAPSKRMLPQLAEVTAEAHHIILSQLTSLRRKAETGEMLDAKEVTMFAKLADSLAKLDRMQREREKMADPANYETKDLIAMLPDFVKALKDVE